MQGRLDEAAAVMEGDLISGLPEALWRGAALDSRRITGGELFFALAGERTDGHRFVRQALENGAGAAVVQSEVTAPEGGGLIHVEDTYDALHDLTRWARQRTPEKLVAVTGTVGKTTTKEMLADMLARSLRVAKSPGNLNNLLGFPVALLGIPEDAEYMVAEMGMSTPGELSKISRLGLPDVAIFTNVRPGHLETLGSLQEVAEAKAELLHGLNPDGLLVANRDDPHVVKIAQRFAGRVVWFALEAAADYRAENIEFLDEGVLGSRFLLVTPEGSVSIDLPLVGRYNVENCVAAAACAHALGVSLTEIREAAIRFEPATMRGVVHRLPGSTILIDDSYNSNPAALLRALESAAEPRASRRWAVLGDMLELGSEAPAYHRAAGLAAARLGFSPIVGVGREARRIVEGAVVGGSRTLWFQDAVEAASALGQEARPGDVILVKGSRGVCLETVVDALLESAGARG